MSDTSVSTWRVKLAPATFRGVPFYVESSDFTTGRRVVDHEYPFRDDAPFTEDMGRASRGLSIDAYVLGDDYFVDRDALLTALETPGPGELIHPYLGTINVAVGTVRVRESSKDGGIAFFNIDFRESSTQATQPVAIPDPPAAVTAASDATKLSLREQFIAKFSAAAALKDSAIAALTSAATTMQDIASVAAMPGQALAEVTSAVNNVISTASTLADAPEDLADAVINLVESLAAGLLLVTESKRSPIARILELYDFDPGTRPPETTPNREAERQNFDALQHLIQRMTICEASTIAITMSFLSYNEAVDARLLITDVMDDHVDAVTDDTYPEIETLRSALVSAIPGPDGDLPRLVTHTPRATIPSLVLAHTLYGNLDLEEDIVRRNNAPNPGFLTGGVELEVLGE